MDTLPILAICNKETHGDAHWRIVRPFARLRERGVDAQICWLGPDRLPTLPVEGRVVVLQRVIVSGDSFEATRTWTDHLRAAGARALVFEIDDDEISGADEAHMDQIEPLTRADREELARRRQATIWMLQACDGATVSTEPLAEVVRRYTDRPVITVPNAIDEPWFRERLDPRPAWAEHPTIGWAGWRRPDADLAPVAEAWERIARRYPDVRFVVGGHQSDVIYARDIPLDRIIRLPISDLDGYPRMHQVSIGCCSVADSPFARCKTPIKAWEYGLAGAALVYSKTLYGDCLTDWVDGYQAESADEWEERLGRLVEYEDHRREKAAMLLDHVEGEHTLAGNLDTWVRAYAGIAESVGARA